MSAPSGGRRRRASYREPTLTGVMETVGSDLWGAGVAGERSDLHKVLFLSLGGRLEEWAAPAGAPGGRDASTVLQATARQADAVIEWLAGRDRSGL